MRIPTFRRNLVPPSSEYMFLLVLFIFVFLYGGCLVIPEGKAAGRGVNHLLPSTEVKETD
jgi:hypothetical protein